MRFHGALLGQLLRGDFCQMLLPSPTGEGQRWAAEGVFWSLHRFKSLKQKAGATFLPILFPFPLHFLFPSLMGWEEKPVS